MIKYEKAVLNEHLFFSEARPCSTYPSDQEARPCCSTCPPGHATEFESSDQLPFKENHINAMTEEKADTLWDSGNVSSINNFLDKSSVPDELSNSENRMDGQQQSFDTDGVMFFDIENEECSFTEKGYDSDKDKEYIPSTSCSEDDDDFALLRKKTKMHPLEEVVCEKLNETSALCDRSVSERVKGKILEKRKEIHKKRNFGVGYTTITGKVMSSRQSKELNPCRKNCKSRLNLTHEAQQKIFKEYWNLGEYNKRLSYISSLISYSETKTSRKKT